MIEMTTADVAYNEVAHSVECIKNGEPATVYMDSGDVLRQGDIYIIRLDREIPHGVPTQTRQLAPGTTKGSRHVASGDCDVLTAPEDESLKLLNRLIPATRGQTLFIGPMIRARGPLTIEHPEHGWRTLPGDGCYLVVFQRTWANEIRRALD